ALAGSGRGRADGARAGRSEARGSVAVRAQGVLRRRPQGLETGRAGLQPDCAAAGHLGKELTMAGRPSKNLSLQKDTERRHIELFLALARLRASLEFGDRPDCVLVLAGRRIGLEHRELCDQDLLWTRPHLKRLGSNLKAELEARSLPLHVRVHLTPHSSWLGAPPSRFVPS